MARKQCRCLYSALVSSFPSSTGTVAVDGRNETSHLNEKQIMFLTPALSYQVRVSRPLEPNPLCPWFPWLFFNKILPFILNHCPRHSSLPSLPRPPCLFFIIEPYFVILFLISGFRPPSEGDGTLCSVPV